MKNRTKNEKNVEQNVSPVTKRGFSFTEKTLKRLVLISFAAVWLLLAFFESVQLYRINELSLFLPTEQFFKEMMTAPAGMLSYISCFLIQFFYYPALGSAIYVLLLYVVYILVRKVFAIPPRWSLAALLPVALLLATNMFVGYSIYYMKLQGYFYAAVIGVIVILLAMWAYKKLPMWGNFVFVVLWTISAYPLIGMYALLGTLMMSIQTMFGKDNIVARISLLILSLALVAAIPALFYGDVYTTTTLRLSYAAGAPAYQWTILGDWPFMDRMWILWKMWLPFVLLFVTLLVYAALTHRTVECKKIKEHYTLSQLLLMIGIMLVTWTFWYNDKNFKIEIEQNQAVWDEDWERVAELGKATDDPTRLIVINRNIALLRLGRAGEDMFRFPDGSTIPNSFMEVRLVQTGGKMAYYQYGCFNFCYRWCVEDAVEFGWRVEFLKQAVLSLVASGQYKTARRYIDILKHTMFHSSWAERYEKIIDNPKLAEKSPEISFPRKMFCYINTLDSDDSFAEAYLLRKMPSNAFVNPSPVCTEASLMHALIRKDTQIFWNKIVSYLNTHKAQLRIPTHYQEALLLYGNIDRRADLSHFKFDKKIEQKFRAFLKLTKKYKGMDEMQMAPYFKDEFGDTYWYFYFFVRNIKSY